jgi:hypothetical protein
MRAEKYGARDLSYSAWHRAASIRRYVGWEHAAADSRLDVEAANDANRLDTAATKGGKKRAGDSPF